AAATRVVSLGSVGEPATTRSAGVAGSTQPDHRRAESDHRARSREVSARAALDDASGGGSVNRTGVRANHWKSRTISVWETDRQLSGISAAREVEWKSTTTGPHHETRKLDIAFLAGGSGPGHGPQCPRMAQQVFPPADAAGGRKSPKRKGTPSPGLVVLDLGASTRARAEGRRVVWS